VALRRDDHSPRSPTVCAKKDYETEEEAKAQQRQAEPLMNEWMKWTWRATPVGVYAPGRATRGTHIKG
jgi:hypothetical protein